MSRPLHSAAGERTLDDTAADSRNTWSVKLQFWEGLTKKTPSRVYAAIIGQSLSSFDHRLHHLKPDFAPRRVPADPSGGFRAAPGSPRPKAAELRAGAAPAPPSAFPTPTMVPGVRTCTKQQPKGAVQPKGISFSLSVPSG